MNQKATESSGKHNPRNTQHGLSLMKRALKEHGTRAIDRRTSLGKALDRWREELILDLGGVDHVSTQQLAIINVAVRTRLLLDSIDTWLLKQPSLINHRKRSVHPVVLQRQQLADSLTRAMTQLGLEKKAKPPTLLTDYLSKKQETDGAPVSSAGSTGNEPQGPV